MNRRTTSSDETMCILCDFWWLWLTIFVLIIAAILTREYWLPLVMPQGARPVPTLSVPTVIVPRTTATPVTTPAVLPTPTSKIATPTPSISAPTEAEPFGIGAHAPDFNLPQLGGGQISLSAYRGKPILLVFFASFDSYSEAQATTIRKLGQNYGDKLVILPIDIAYNDLAENVNKFVSENKWTFPIAMDETGAIQALYEQNSIPAYVFIDATGKIFAIEGVMTSEQLEKKVSDLVK